MFSEKTRATLKSLSVKAKRQMKTAAPWVFEAGGYLFLALTLRELWAPAPLAIASLYLLLLAHK